ncbi:MAG: hypothetical protein EZS28_002602, partial [Streblomastix strix]
MEKGRQIEFDRKQQAMIQQQSKPQQSQMQKDLEDTLANPKIDLKYISPQHNTPHKPSSPHPQQHSPSPSLEETLAILRTISPVDPRGYKERESEPKQPKLRQYATLMDVIERLHEIMKPIIEEEKKKPKAMLLGQYKHFLNKYGPLFFYPPKNYRPSLSFSNPGMYYPLGKFAQAS